MSEKKRTKGVHIMNASPEVKKNIKEQKFDFCYERIIQGMRYTDICRAFAEHFGDTERNAKNHIKKVNEHLANPAPQERAKALNKQRARYEDIYNKLYAQGKYKEAADVLPKIDRLEGLDKVIIEQNVNHNQGQFDLASLPLEMLLQMQQYLPGGFIEEVTDVAYEEAQEEENPEDNVSGEEDPE